MQYSLNFVIYPIYFNTVAWASNYKKHEAE